MIKSTLICRASDGLPLCQANDYTSTAKELQETRHEIKKHQKELNAVRDNGTVLKQIESSHFGIFYKLIDGIIYTVICDLQYPAKMANIYLDTIIAAFADELKTTYGASVNVRSKIETIENSHYFIKFDRVIKVKKADYEDVNSSKNIERLKKDMESLKQVVKVNLDMINDRTVRLNETEEKAKRIREDAAKFKTTTSKLKWHMWFKSNLFWLILILLVCFMGYMML